MKYASALLLVIIVFTFSNCKDYSSHKTANEIIVEIPDRDSHIKKIRLTAYSPAVIKVEGAPSDSLLQEESLITDSPAKKNFYCKIKENKDHVLVVTSRLRVKLEIPSGIVKFYDSDSQLLVSEGVSELQKTGDTVDNGYKIKQEFNWRKGEAHYGLGQHENGVLDYRGHKINLYQTNTKISIPVLLSTKGYGLLWDNYSETVYNDKNDNSYIKSEVGDKIRYYFMYGPDFDSIIGCYRNLTGKVPMYPKWAMGFFQSRNRYWTQDELLQVVEKYRQKEIPLDAIVLDYMHWENGTDGFGSFNFDKEAVPNPEKMINTLHQDYNCKILTSSWPSFSKGTKNWKHMKDKGYLMDVTVGYNTQVYDAYNPDARELYWKMLKDTYLERGVDGLWFDVTEPENKEQLEKSTNYLGSSRKYLNTYALFHTRSMYNNLVEYNREKRPYILTRSAFAGQQKYGTTCWSGDIGTSFEALQKQIPAGLNFCATGIPYWTTDIGGYAGGKPDDPEYRELYVRWFQYGTFCPVFRTHGRRHPGDRKTPNEVWSYGSEAESILTDYIRLRYRLMPYIYSLSRKVSSEGYTIMRNLAFNFRKDTNVYNIKDQFMFGDEMLINPVIKSGARDRSVYLPEGTQWYNFWTGESYQGGQSVTVKAPMDKMPIFVQAGSIIPFGPNLQYATQKKADPVELRIYSGDDASFTLYTDENDGHDYKSGAFSLINISYDEDDETVRIGEREGEFPGMLEHRTFKIIRVEPGSGIGIAKPAKADTTIHYNGNAKQVSF